LVRGPIVTTQSSLDYAVRKLYPKAAGIARQVAMADRNSPVYPKYGGVGCFGIQGPGCNSFELDVLLDTSKSHGFKAGSIYNLECSSVIKEIANILSGAHSHISHPQVAHAFWEAAM